MDYLYNTYIINNPAILEQGVFVGLSLIGVCCLTGWGIYQLIHFFMEISEERR